MKFTKRSQRGFALILVLLIGAIMMIPVLMLLSAVAPKRASVTGEAVSDIALASADGVVDKIATKINTFPTLLSSNSYITSNLVSMSGNVSMAQFAMGYLLSTYLNGGHSSYSTDYTKYYSQLATIQDSVSTYLCDTTTGKYYVVCDANGYIASVGNVVGFSGDVASKPIGDLATVTAAGSMTVVSQTGMPGMGDSSPWATDNRWIEIDTNTQFSDAGTNSDGTSRFTIRATAYPLSSNKDMSGRMRTVQAEVFLGHVKVAASGWTDVATGVFTNAVWSGGNMNFSTGSKTQVYGNIYAEGHVYAPSGGTFKGYIHSEDYVELNSTGTGSMTIGGDVQARNYIKLDDQGVTLSNGQSGPKPIGGNNVNMYTGASYPQPAESLPTFDSGTISTAAMNTAQATRSVLSGNYSTSETAPVTVGASNSPLPYYISGNVGTNDITLNFVPIAGSTVAWYVGGSVTISGNVTLNFTSPCIIVVGGAFNVSTGVVIKGHGTIIAKKLNLTCPVTGSGTDPKIAMIATGTDNPALYVSSGVTGITAVVYAPNGSVALQSANNIVGSIVAKNGVSLPAGAIVTYDPTLASPGGSSFVPGPPSVSFTFKIGSSTAFKRSWKELISAKYTVSPLNFTNGNFPAPIVDQTNSDYSS